MQLFSLSLLVINYLLARIKSGLATAISVFFVGICIDFVLESTFWAPILYPESILHSWFLLLLGGTVGIGTLVAVSLTGPIVAFVM